jgi:hypothetical protein
VQATFIADQPRARRYGAGRPPKLNDDRDKLLFIRVKIELLDLRGFQNLGGLGERSSIDDPKNKL